MKAKKIKLILWDFNGVTVTGDHKSTSRKYGKIHGTPWKKVYNILYTKYFNMVVENKISERDGWIKSIQELGWQQDWRLMRKWHLHQHKIRKTVVLYVTSLRRRGYKCVLLSKNLATWFVIEEGYLHFKQYFDTTINTQALNLPKARKKTMQYICKRFDVGPSEIIYIDDLPQNLKVPESMGVKTVLYKNFKQIRREVTSYL
ncbi:HAD hydrolase-like protein [Patescibacteria group bacterium]|nr:HAD hydrolase-like protein [Patescibacteria group bacterium]